MTTVMEGTEFVQAVVDRLGNDSFKNDLLLPILKADEEELLHGCTRWMLEGGMVDSLLQTYMTTDSGSAHKNIAEVLHELARDSKSCLEILQQKENVATLLSSLSFDEGQIGATADSENTTDTTNISPAAVQMKNANADSIYVLVGLIGSLQSNQEEEDEFADPDAPTATDGALPECVLVICEHLPVLAKALAPSQVPPATTYSPQGPVEPPLGKLRLAALQLFSLLLRGYKTVQVVQDGFIQHKVLGLCVDILFSHPWHNIAHVFILELLKNALEDEAGGLRQALLEGTDLTRRLVETMVALPPRLEEGVAPDRSYHRPGNIGTIVDLALHMESQTELGALGFAQLAEDEAWRGMVTGPLAEEKRLQALELGQAVPSALAGLNMGDTSSSDEERDPDNNSSGSSDEDDDPLRHFGANTADNNNMADAFKADTTFVNDGADAWESHEIVDASADNEWVANFEAMSTNTDAFPADSSAFDADPWANSGDVTNQEAMDWKADFESSSTPFGVEDPFAAAVAEETPPFEADFGAIAASGSPPPEEAVEVNFAEAFEQAAGIQEAKEALQEVIDEELTAEADLGAEEVPEDPFAIPETAQEEFPAEIVNEVPES